MLVRLALSILFAYLTLVSGAGILFAVGIPFGPVWWGLYGAGAVLGAIAFRNFEFEISNLRSTAVVLVLHGALLFAAAGISSRVLDVGWDSLETHQRAVALLREGWNILDPQPGFIDAQPEDSLLKSPPAVFPHYLDFNGMYVASTLFSTLPSGWEGGKGYRLLLLLMLGILSAGMLRQSGLGPGASVVAGIFVAANPQALFQLWSLFMDFDVAVFSSLAIVGLLALSWEGARGGAEPGEDAAAQGKARVGRFIPTVAVTAVAVILLALSKRSGLAFALPLGALLVLWVAVAGIRRSGAGRRLALAGGAAALFAGAAVAVVLPLVGSASSRLDPYYSLGFVKRAIMDPDAFDRSLDIRVPDSVSGLSRPAQFGRSLLESTDVYRGAPIKVPFTWGPGEWASFRNIKWPGHGSAGFGPLFSGVLLLALAAWILATVPSPRRLAPGWWFRLLLFGTLLGICFVLPSWWSRWVPFVWCFPLFLLLPPFFLRTPRGTGSLLLLAGHRRLLASFCASTALLVGLANAGAILAVSTGEALSVTGRIEKDLQRAAAAGNGVRLAPDRSLMVKRWFVERGIEYRLEDGGGALLFALEPTAARVYEIDPKE